MESNETNKDQDLLEKMTQIKKTVRRNFQDMVNLLTSVISLSSPYLGGHLRRVAETGKAMADLLEIPKEDSYAVYYAGLLHDIGLMGLPETLLTSPGGVQSEEAAEIYNNHPQIAADIVNTVYDLRRVGGLIRSHHEDYNGQGFPEGLKGKDIPAGARILRIVNDYDVHLYVMPCFPAAASTTTRRFSNGSAVISVLKDYPTRAKPGKSPPQSFGRDNFFTPTFF